jgi:GH24 family phage-related lysozyme (muramidase)
MTLDADLIAEEEGPSSALAFKDSEGYWSICRSTLVDPNPALHAEGLCQQARDVQDAYELAKARALAEELPGFQRCNEVRQAVLVSMCYQLGSLAAWHNLKAGLALGDYDVVADNMLYERPPDTAWTPWHTETPERCERAAAMMRSGEWIAKT